MKKSPLEEFVKTRRKRDPKSPTMKYMLAPTVHKKYGARDGRK